MSETTIGWLKEPTDHDLLCAAGVSARAASALLARLGTTGLAGVTVAELVAAGVPAKTAAKVHAAMTLGRRAVTRAAERRPLLGQPADVYEAMRDRAATLDQEVFWVIAINIRNEVIDVVEVARGTVSGVEVHPREVFRAAIRIAAAGVVLVHNHPSGDPTPSAEDVELTRRLRAAGELTGIPVLDHVVIASRGFRSIAEWMGTSL
jgi:DNA repair protein RadC